MAKFDFGGAMTGGLAGGLGANFLGLGAGEGAATILGGLNPWIAGAALGGSLLGGFFGGDEEEMEQGYDVFYPEEYEYTRPMLGMQADYLMSELSRLQRGDIPGYLEQALPQMRALMAEPLARQYYGTPGERSGILGDVASVGAMTGIGPKATQAQLSKAQEQYAYQNEQIDRYLASIIPQYQQAQQSTVLQSVLGMPRNPEYTVINRMGGVQSGGQSSSLSNLAGLASAIPWENFGGGGGGSTTSGEGVTGDLYGQLMNKFNPYVGIGFQTQIPSYSQPVLTSISSPTTKATTPARRSFGFGAAL